MEGGRASENHGRDRLPDGLPDGQVSESCLLPYFRQKQHWSKPQCGTFKVNSDGAFDRETGSGGWGFIIRDDQGMMVKAGAGGEAFL